jgi:putative glycerol-1-phosphate prenyltransferase
MQDILSSIQRRKSRGEKMIALLIDPDFYQNADDLIDAVQRAEKAKVDYLFYGGSLITQSGEIDSLKLIKDITSLPVILFPSSPAQIDPRAEGILFLTLLSGRNPEYLIGHHVAAAPLLKNANIEILSTGYLLIGCGETTTAEYVSNTQPIPYHKPDIAATTALAGEMLGVKLIYLDGGSGAEKPISKEMIRKVSKNISLPLIIGGGIRSAEDAIRAFEAGADVIVVGNGVQESPKLISKLSVAKSHFL